MKKIIFILIGLFLATNASAASVLFPYQGGTGIGSATAGDIGKCVVVSGSSPFTYGFSTCGTGGGFPSFLGQIGDVSTTTLANGYVLKYNGTTWESVATSTLGLGGSSGTVSSVALTVPTGFTISGSPVTSAGTLGVGFTSGYSLPLTASTTEGSTAFTWGNHALAGYVTGTPWTGLGYITLSSLSGTAPVTYNSGTGAIGCTTASSGVAGCLSNTAFDIFNGKQDALGYTPLNQASYFSTTTQNTITTLPALSITKSQVSDFGGPYLTASALTPYFPLADWFSTTTQKTISSLPALSITKSQVSDFGTYQAPLVSGTNIKTINSNSLLGSGDLTIGGMTSYDAWTHPAYGGSATTSLVTVNGLLSTASSTFVSTLKVGGNLTTNVTGTAGNCLHVDANGVVSGMGADCGTAGGEANTGSSLGTGLNIFDSKGGVDLRFNSIKAGTNITLSTSTNANTIVVNALATTTNSLFSGLGGQVLTYYDGLGWFGFSTTSMPVGGDVTGTLGTTIVGDDSHNHTGSTISGLGVVDFTSANISQWTNDSAYARFPFTVNTGYNSTSTVIGFNGLFSTASSTFSGDFFLPQITSALTLTGADGKIAEYTGTSCTNQFIRSLSVLGVATCASVANTDLANSTISGVALGANLNALTNGNSLNGSSYNGSSAISDWDINFANPNSWTGLQQFANSTSTLFSATTGWFTDMYFPSFSQGYVFAGTGGKLGTVASSSVLLAGDVGGNITATVIGADTVHDTMIDWGSAANQVDLADIPGGISGANVWDFGGAASLEIPNGSPTVDTTGEIGIDTTSGQFKWSYNGASLGVVVPFYTMSFNVSSTTWGSGTTTVSLAPATQALTVVSAKCETSAGTLNVSLYDGTNRANLINASTTIGTFTYSTNNTFTSSESMRIDVGTAASSPKWIGCRFKYTYDAD